MQKQQSEGAAMYPSFNEVEPQAVMQQLEKGASFVLNIVTRWCPDCTERQAQHIDAFAQQIQAQGMAFYQVNVQMLKNEFISSEHEALTTAFGGRGYPRTVLVLQGEIVDKDNVEVMTQAALDALAQRFIARAKSQTA